MKLLTLGATAIELNSQRVTLSVREATLLAFCNSKPAGRLPRQLAAEKLWPNKPADKARHSLSQLLYSLNNKVPHPAIRAYRDELVAEQMDWDVNALHAAFAAGDHERAMLVYHGTFLPHSQDSIGALGEWRDAVQLRVSEEVAAAAYELALSEDGDWLAAVEKTSRLLLQSHPFLEKAQYAAICSAALLHGEAAAREIHSEIVAADTDVPPLASFLNRQRRNVTRSLPFKGRSEELDRLMAIYHLADKGSGQTAIVAGEAGIGKTRLVDQALRRVALHGGRTWTVNCCAATQRIPYGAARDLFSDNQDSMPAATKHAISSAFHQLECSTDSNADQARHRLIQQLTAAVAEQTDKTTLAIFVDDAQWADDFTGVLICYWAHRFRDKRVLIILAVRTCEADSVPEWISVDLSRSEYIRLGHLSIDSARALTKAFEAQHSIAIPDSIRDGILWLSAGRPFLLLEALRTILQENDPPPALAEKWLSPSSQSILSRRFRMLTREATDICEFLAVWAKPASQDLLSAALKLSPAEVADAVDSLCDRGILDYKSGTVCFVHDLMREAAYRNTLAAARDHLHTMAAEFLLRVGEPIGMAAEHFWRAGRLEKASELALRAADEAATAKLFSDYEYYLRMAARSQSPDIKEQAVLSLAHYLIQVGRTSEIADILHVVDTTTPSGSFISHVYHLDRALSGGHPAADVVNSAQMLLQSKSSELTMVVGTLIDIALDASNPDFCRTLLSVIQAAPNLDQSLQYRAYATLMAAADTGYESAIEAAQNLVCAAAEAIFPATRALSHHALGTLLLLAGRLPESISEFEMAIRNAEEAGDVRRQYATLINLGVALMENGRPDDARRCFVAALECANVHVRARAYANLAILNFHLGEWDLATDAAKTVLSMNASYGSTELTSVAVAISSLVRLKRVPNEYGDEDGRDHNDSTLERPFKESSYATILDAHVLAARGRLDEATALLNDESRRLRPHNVLASLRLIAALADLVTPTNKDRAFRLASDVRTLASSIGAHLVEQQAIRTLEATRY